MSLDPLVVHTFGSRGRSYIPLHKQAPLIQLTGLESLLTFLQFCVIMRRLVRGRNGYIVIRNYSV